MIDACRIAAFVAGSSGPGLAHVGFGFCLSVLSAPVVLFYSAGRQAW